MIASIGIFALGVVLLVVGGDMLVRGAIALAGRLGVSPLVIGLTVVAFGTSAPELALNIVAAINGNTELSFGNIVGSNIANVGLILGLSALIKPMQVKATLVTREIPLMLAATLAFIALGYVNPPAYDGAPGLARLDGVILLTLFAGVFLFILRMSRSEGVGDGIISIEEQEQMADVRRTPLGLSIMLFLFGLGLLLGGGKLAETGAVQIAASIGMSNELIGLTVVAVATSLPELATSLIAARKGQVDIAVGNVVGSNLFNILLVMGVTSTVAPVPLPQLALSSLLMMALLSLLLWPMSLTSGRMISRVEGSVLLALYFGYMGYEVVTALSRQ